MKQKQTVEDYLKTIYLLSKSKSVHGSDIAEKLNVSRPTVSVSLKALQQEGYIILDDLHEIHLTEHGKEIAQETYDRHQMFKNLLSELGVDEKTASEDACKMEHALSSESYAALKKYIGNIMEHQKL